MGAGAGARGGAARAYGRSRPPHGARAILRRAHRADVRDVLRRDSLAASVHWRVTSLQNFGSAARVNRFLCRGVQLVMHRERYTAISPVPSVFEGAIPP